MALCKFLHGDSSRLDSVPFHEGYIYVTTDEQMMYFDINVGTEESPNNKRIPLNAKDAETILGISPSTLVNNVDTEIPTSKAILTKLTEYALASHNHTISNVDGLQEALDESVVSLSASGRTITYTKGDGNTETITTQDTVYTHPTSGVTEGTYKSVVVDEYGHVTSGSNPTTLAGFGIVDAEAKGTASSTVSTHNTSTSAHNDIRLLISDLNKKVTNFLDVDETTTDQLSEILALIEANADDIDKITSGKINVSDIVNNLTTNVSNKPLSASQGVVLKGLIDTLQIEVNGKSDASHTHEYAGSSTIGGSANSAVKLDSSAGSETQPIYFKDGKPVATTYTLNKSVPSDAKFTDTIITKTSELINDSGYLTEHPEIKQATNVFTSTTAKFGDKFDIIDGITTDSNGHIKQFTGQAITLPSNIATSDTNGLMSAIDKLKLDGIDFTTWTGTKAEYDAIAEKDEKCLYITIDDNEEPTVELVSNKVTVLNDSATNEQYPSARAVWNILSNLNQYEQIKNKVTSLDENSTDEQYPTAKAVYEGAFSVANKVAEEAEKLENKVTSISSSSTDVQYPSAKATYSAINTLDQKSEKIANKVTVIDDNASNTTYPSSLAVKNVITEKVDSVIPELEQKIEEGTANVVRTTEDATMNAKLVAQNNSDYTVAQVRNIIIMEHDPSVEDMADGEICIVI